MKKKLVIISINVFCLVAFLVCHIVSASMIAPLHTGQAVDAWAGQSGERFAQLAVFFPASYEFTENSIYSARRSIDNSLLAVSLEDSDGRTLYSDAWSSDSSASIVGQRGRASASIIGVGGNFFLFHPMRLRSGSYITHSDLMRDRVVLDEELAWRLYGGIDLAGFEVLINGNRFVISGVVARETDVSNSKAYDGGAGLFMSYEALSAMQGGNARINSYEIVMPDLVTNFAMNALTEALSDESLHIVDNTERFSYANLFRIIGSFGERSMRAEAMEFPYWENAVRYTEDWLALLLFISLVMIICPIVFAVIRIVKIVRFWIDKAKNAINNLYKKYNDRAYRRYLERQNTV